ncbi:MAG TPA: hypothetical protein VGG04_02825 [Candidatus Sulfotelmatobacter sp.]|jgi:regulator of RNase E activity RraA
MANAPLLTAVELDALRQFDTCMIANAIEKFHIRLRNTGFTNGKIRCMFPEAPPLVGYAVTGRVRSGDPPIAGAFFRDRGELWGRILETPAPRVLVLEDIDERPGLGAFVGDMHAAILSALGCSAYVTNGAVRELPSVRRIGIQLFAATIAVSHAYAHIFDIGSPVTVDGMEVRTGTLLHGDQHGMVTIPAEIAREVPNVAAKLQGAEEEVIEFCRSTNFSVASLNELMTRKL